MSKRGKVMSILVMCLLFFISCEKIDSFIEKNSVDTEEQMESTEGTISDISSDISNDIENEIKNNKELATDDKEDHNARDNRRKRVVIQTKIGDHLRRSAF